MHFCTPFFGGGQFFGAHFYTLARRWHELLHARFAYICARHQQAGVDFFTPIWRAFVHALVGRK